MQLLFVLLMHSINYYYLFFSGQPNPYLSAAVWFSTLAAHPSQCAFCHAFHLTMFETFDLSVLRCHQYALSVFPSRIAAYWILSEDPRRAAVLETLKSDIKRSHCSLF